MVNVDECHEKSKGFIVVLDYTLHDEGVQHVIDALMLIKGVIAVKPVPIDAGDEMIRQRTRRELLNKILAVFDD